MTFGFSERLCLKTEVGESHPMLNWGFYVKRNTCPHTYTGMYRTHNTTYKRKGKLRTDHTVEAVQRTIERQNQKRICTMKALSPRFKPVALNLPNAEILQQLVMYPQTYYYFHCYFLTLLLLRTVMEISVFANGLKPPPVKGSLTPKEFTINSLRNTVLWLLGSRQTLSA